MGRVCGLRLAIPYDSFRWETALAIPSFFVAGNFATSDTYLDPEILVLRVLQHRICVAIIADEGASFQKPRFHSPDLTLKGQKVPKSGHFKMRKFMRFAGQCQRPQGRSGYDVRPSTCRTRMVWSRFSTRRVTAVGPLTAAKAVVPRAERARASSGFEKT